MGLDDEGGGAPISDAGTVRLIDNLGVTAPE